MCGVNRIKRKIKDREKRIIIVFLIRNVMIVVGIRIKALIWRNIVGAAHLIFRLGPQIISLL